MKMIATKEDLNNLDANFDIKINILSNILLEQLQNSTAETFGLAEISQKSGNGMEIKMCTHWKRLGALTGNEKQLSSE